MGWTVSLAALWKGGRAERLVALGFLAAWLVTPVLRQGGWDRSVWSGLMVDTAFFGLILAVALQSGRYWPLFAAAFELLSVSSHVAKLVDPGVRGWAYATADAIWTYLLLAALSVGVLNRWRERRQPMAAAATPTPEPGATRR